MLNLSKSPPTMSFFRLLRQVCLRAQCGAFLGMVGLLTASLIAMQSASLAQELDGVEQMIEKAKTIKPLTAGVSKSMYLPKEMYGQWSVTATLVETNAAAFYNPMVHDIWVLEHQGDQVIISNPATGASAAINVDRVEGNTATFHRMVVSKKNQVYFEMPTITVNGNRMSGYNINRVQFVKKGEVKRSVYARYRLEAERIGQSRAKFGAPSQADDLEFDIEDIRPGH